MSRFKKWLYNRFLPAWCRDELMETNEKLRKVINMQEQEIERLNAYIDGMENAMRRNRVVINAREVSK